MKHRYALVMFALILAVVEVSSAQQLDDPRARDEDISATGVSVAVSINSAGHFVYRYDVEAPLSNKGRILLFMIDIGCDGEVDSRGFNPDDYPTDAGRTLSLDHRHVPVAIDAPWGEAAAFRIGFDNDIRWSLAANPGTDSRGLQIISPYPPGDREYKLIPSVRHNEARWDYSNVEEDDPEIPWIKDWTVTGIITGPACPGKEYPDDGEPEPRFAGSLHAGQAAALNDLLTYSAPLRDQLHLEPGTREFEMTIHYDEAIDPRTFRVTPQRNQLRRLFNPAPGTSETVRIPLESGKNRIELQVQTRFVPPGQGEQPPQAVQGRGGVNMDQDVFVIRVPDDGPGKGRGNALSRSQDAPGQGRGSNSND